MNYRIDLNEPKILRKVNNDNLGLYASQSWKKDVDPFTPHDIGNMENTAILSPWQIEYSATASNGYHYPRRVYYDISLNFQKIHNPFATHNWDKAAEQAGKKTDLYRQINEYLHR